jgi:hypothetical protein
MSEGAGGQARLERKPAEAEVVLAELGYPYNKKNCYCIFSPAHVVAGLCGVLEM